LDIGVLSIKVFTIFVLMALITTLLTTPMVWLLYKRKEDKKPKIEIQPSQNVTSILMYINDTRVGYWMGIVSQVFHGKKSISLFPLVIKEVSDRPSSYFFSDVYYKPTTRKRGKVALAPLKSKMEKESIEYQMKTLISAHIPSDLVSYVEDNSYDIVFLEMKQTVETIVSSPTATFFARGLDTFERAFDWTSTNARVVDHCISSIHSALAILIDKHHENPDSISHLLFIYEEKKHEDYALEVVLNIIASHPEITTTIVTRDTDFLDHHKIENKNVFIYLPKTHTGVEIPKKDYNLIVLGADRKSKEIYKSDLIHNNEIPVLLLYAACVLEHTHEHTGESP